MLRKKILLAISAMLVLAIAVVFILVYLNQQPLTKEQAINHLHSYFEKAGKPGAGFSGVQVLVKADAKGIDEEFAYGVANNNADKILKPNQPFHVASIGKTFTATLVAMLQEEGKIKFSDPVSQYLDNKQLEGLFVFKGVDYQKDVTIEQLMAHTSGIADYFADPTLDGPTIADLIISEPNKLWMPQELIDFTRNQMKAVGKPGDIYHYSDSGYVLLGLLIEKIENKTFDQVLKDRIFIPLMMEDSYMALRSKPINLNETPIADIWFKGVEVSKFNSLTVDWTGGGIISTPEDLLKFQTALQAGKLINPDTLKTLFTMRNKFQSGIYYGLGTMEIKFEEFFPLLRGMPRVVGHIGVLSTHMFYDRETGTQVIMNFGSDTKMVDSFKALIEVINTLKRIKN